MTTTGLLVIVLIFLFFCLLALFHLSIIALLCCKNTDIEFAKTKFIRDCTVFPIIVMVVNIFSPSFLTILYLTAFIMMIMQVDLEWFEVAYEKANDDVE